MFRKNLDTSNTVKNLNSNEVRERERERGRQIARERERERERDGGRRREREREKGFKSDACLCLNGLHYNCNFQRKASDNVINSNGREVLDLFHESY